MYISSKKNYFRIINLNTVFLVNIVKVW